MAKAKDNQFCQSARPRLRRGGATPSRSSTVTPRAWARGPRVATSG